MKLFRHFPKLKIAYLYGKNIFNFSKAKFHSKDFGLLWVRFDEVRLCEIRLNNTQMGWVIFEI